MKLKFRSLHYYINKIPKLITISCSFWSDLFLDKFTLNNKFFFRFISILQYTKCTWGASSRW